MPRESFNKSISFLNISGLLWTTTRLTMNIYEHIMNINCLVIGSIQTFILQAYFA